MFIVAIWVMALFLLAIGLWQVGTAAYLADLYFWNYLTESPGKLTELSVNGRTVDPQTYLTEQAIYGSALVLVALGFLFIARRVGAKGV